jgi:hypothetical protein
MAPTSSCLASHLTFLFGLLSRRSLFSSLPPPPVSAILITIHGGVRSVEISGRCGGKRRRFSLNFETSTLPSVPGLLNLDGFVFQYYVID